MNEIINRNYLSKIKNRFTRNNQSVTKYIQFDKHKCEACWKCIENCPKKVFRKVNIFGHKHSHIFQPNNCKGCKKCITVCDFKAISPII
jgi:MinD superfamily P-loop ATPase